MPKGQKRKTQDDDGDEDYGKRAAPKTAGKRKAKAGKPTVEKRFNAAGGTSRYSAAPSQHVKDRIQRALPGKALMPPPHTRYMPHASLHFGHLSQASQLFHRVESSHVLSRKRSGSTHRQ